MEVGLGIGIPAICAVILEWWVSLIVARVTWGTSSVHYGDQYSQVA